MLVLFTSLMNEVYLFFNFFLLSEGGGAGDVNGLHYLGCCLICKDYFLFNELLNALFV